MKSSRLLSILLLLQTYERMTSNELAKRLEVSQRTILRDVLDLSAAGVPVYTEQGRGGAIVLDRRARLDLTRLNPSEIQLLTVAGMNTAVFDQIGLGSVHTLAQRKLNTVATDRQLSDRLPLSEVLLIDSSGWYARSKELDLTDLLDVSRKVKRIHLSYRRSGEAYGAWIIADPYGLVNKAGSWYLVADVDGEPRLFNTNRIVERNFLEEDAVLRANMNLRLVWAELVDSFQPTTGIEIDVLLRSTRLDLAQRILGTRIVNITDTNDEWTPMVVLYPDIESVRQLLQFGDHIRISGPAEAITRFHDLAVNIANVHQLSS